MLILLGQVATEILLPISLVQLTEQAQLAAYKQISTSVALANVGALAGLMTGLCVIFLLCGGSAGLLSS